MKIKNKFFILILTIIFTYTFSFIPIVKAADVSPSNLDVIFVLDASGSMKESDPQEIRTEAIKMFVDMCQLKGNRIGFIAYSDNIVREHNLDLVNSDKDKENIKKMASNIPFGQKTDTGLGLIEAVRLMENGHEQSHKPVIVLLSDGKNDPQRSSNESLGDLKKAIDLAKTNNYPIYSIGLNYDGTVDKAQLKEISDSTKGKVYITNTAEDLTKILTDIYADNSNLKIQDAGTINLTGGFDSVKLNIPNSNVLEANVSMLSDKPVEIKLIDPKGKSMDVPSKDVFFTSSAKYSMLKILKPIEGDWTIQVKGVSGNNLKISYIFNYDIQVEAKGKLNKNVVEVEAFLANNGSKINDKELNKDLKAKLIAKNLKNNKEEEVALNLEGDIFKGQYTLKESEKYECKVRIDGNSFYRESSAFIIDGTENAKSQVQPAQNIKPKENFFEKPLNIAILAIALILIVTIVVLSILKKKLVGGFGRIMIQIRDENSGEVSPPQYRSLSSYKGSFSLFEVLGLKEEFSETEKLRFIFKKNDTIEINNKSECVIKKNGRNVGKENGSELINGNRITVYLNKVQKSITMEFYTK